MASHLESPKLRIGATYSPTNRKSASQFESNRRMADPSYFKITVKQNLLKETALSQRNAQIKLLMWSFGRKRRSGLTLKISLLIPGERKDRIEELMIYVILCASKELLQPTWHKNT
ncbi:uncharacterized protein LACBIDRAFT_328101 [Laccaria bicolor S238N-H82]|uniref:Predicted protein n=1 Tax=Laccaria bicolor (strain S238N-H82 / ATCC MYA-4686) TaxID=486041 RepID=B0DDS2_LACBS|nr:uncharacterized protein LACBIDRAFT_328101 [Laccaria bicolor S238N-H82]EDR07260.1 predicted protein [Laccaria bicolor S238N-H82]|eukprot:XP_001882191.1 predicted protein [Laccaria bicolor S238N-H82]